jgi:hypothetical protein
MKAPKFSFIFILVMALFLIVLVYYNQSINNFISKYLANTPKELFVEGGPLKKSSKGATTTNKSSKNNSK